MATPVYTDDIIPAQNRAEITSVNDEDLLIVSQDNALKKITKANLQETLGVNDKADKTTTYTKTEVDSIADEKVAIDDIYNGLDSTLTDVPLSANQGYKLASGGVNNNSLLPSKMSFLEEGTSSNLLSLVNIPETTKNGLTYSLIDGVLKIDGTSTDVVALNLYLNNSIQPGSYFYNSFNSGSTTIVDTNIYLIQDNSAGNIFLGIDVKNKEITLTDSGYRIQLYIRADKVFDSYETKLELSNEKQFSYENYVLYKINSDNIRNKDLSIKESMINDNSITTNKIKDGVVTTDKLSFLTHNKETNFINRDNLTSGYFINGDVDGAIRAFDGFYVTDYIELEEDTTYYKDNVYNGYCAFYDADKVYISGFGGPTSATLIGLESPFTIPSGAVYARFTLANDTQYANCWISTTNLKPQDYGLSFPSNLYVREISTYKNENPCLYKGDEVSVFSKGIACGDSITSGTFNHNENTTEEYIVNADYAYPTMFTKITGIPLDNFGFGGKDSVQWYDYYSSYDFSGYDFAIIWLGINDYINGVSTVDSTTALQNIVTKLQTENENIKLFIATVTPAFSDNTTNYDDINTVIKNIVISNTNCYLCDMTNFSQCSQDTVYEQGHLTALGCYKSAKEFANYISYHISENLEDFRNVQFIGTTYNYN